MPRMPGEGVERGEDDDGVVHDVVCSNGTWRFKCGGWTRVYDREIDDYEETCVFSYRQARGLEADGPVTCLDCLARG